MDIKKWLDIPPWEWPEDADRMILAVLRDGNAGESDRLVAARLAGDYTVINDDLAEELLSILLDDRESEEIRGRAVISFGPVLEHAYITEFDDPEDILITPRMFERIQQTLKGLYTQAGIPLGVRRRILEASVRAPQDWHPEAVRTAYGSDDENWILTAVFCMGYIRGFNREIVKSLEHKNPLIHYHAVCAAGNWQVEDAWPHVVAILKNEKRDKDLLLAAIETAAAIKPEKAHEVIDHFLDSKDEEIADTALEAMTMAGALMEELLDEDEDDNLLH